ncbi:lysin [Salmonella phage 18-India]|nr:lysin [Salmonella phage 18-India]
MVEVQIGLPCEPRGFWNSEEDMPKTAFKGKCTGMQVLLEKDDHSQNGA